MARKKIENKIKFKNFGIPGPEATRLEGWKRIYKKSFAWLIRNFFKECGGIFEEKMKYFCDWEKTKKTQESVEENKEIKEKKHGTEKN